MRCNTLTYPLIMSLSKSTKDTEKLENTWARRAPISLKTAVGSVLCRLSSFFQTFAVSLLVPRSPDS